MFLNCDIVVLGASISGYVAAIHAALEGHSVICIDTNIGGYEIHYGYYPRKVIQKLLSNPDYQNRDIEVKPTTYKKYKLDKILFRKQYFIREIQSNIMYLFSKHNIQYLHGTATILDSHTVSFTGSYQDKTYTAEKITVNKSIIIASDPCITREVYKDHSFKSMAYNDPVTASEQNLHFKDNWLPSDTANNQNIHHYRFYTPEEATLWNYCPETLLVIGTDTEALELASLWNAIGSCVHMIIPLSNSDFLSSLDHDVRSSFLQQLSASGIIFFFNIDIQDYVYSQTSDLYHIRLTDDTRAEYQRVISCIKTNLIAHPLLVYDSHNKILVNKHYTTSVSNIYAIGPSITSSQLTHAIVDQARYVVSIINASQGMHSETPLSFTKICYNKDYIDLHIYSLASDSRYIPSIIYASLELATVGCTEHLLLSESTQFSIKRKMFRHKHASGVIKILYSKTSMRILGMSIIGKGAETIACQASTALHLGATIIDIDSICSLPITKRQKFIKNLSCYKHPLTK